MELGFLTGFADGNWGPKSVRALRDYKQQAGLGDNNVWDARTERSLFSNNAAHAIKNMAFIGGWTAEQG
jgi:peptidoglycan hydrolase-like protein with peptidoglycan-binding domain